MRCINHKQVWQVTWHLSIPLPFSLPFLFLFLFHFSFFFSSISLSLHSISMFQERRSIWLFSISHFLHFPSIGFLHFVTSHRIPTLSFASSTLTHSLSLSPILSESNFLSCLVSGNDNNPVENNNNPRFLLFHEVHWSERERLFQWEREREKKMKGLKWLKVSAWNQEKNKVTERERERKREIVEWEWNPQVSELFHSQTFACN